LGAAIIENKRYFLSAAAVSPTARVFSLCKLAQQSGTADVSVLWCG
jgi:hypothetical protein